MIITSGEIWVQRISIIGFHLNPKITKLYLLMAIENMNK